MNPLAVSMRRTDAILRRTASQRPPARPRNRHGRRPETSKAARVRSAVTRVAVALAVAVGAVFAVEWIATAPAAPSSASVAALIPAAEAEVIYLSELADAGVLIPPDREQAAVEIAREHVAHGHLIGMREIIRQDFRERIGGLTEAQVDVARVVVEHHFLAVTGRRQ